MQDDSTVRIQNIFACKYSTHSVLANEYSFV